MRKKKAAVATILVAVILLAVAVVAGPIAAAPGSGHSEEAGGTVRRIGVLTEEEEVPKPRPG
ncbi:MAG TPA: hypothetical protein VFM05_00115 [Candidatus Saccharimonadales bacterium]|nr:hypothetical protein [Candidatus Saccharimonadales bacterium]